MWCVAELDEEYIRKMEDVLELYEREHDPSEPVICLDEKPVTLHRDVRPHKAATPGQPAKTDSEYERCGTANVFCAVEPKAGLHYTRPTADRSAPEFAQILAELALHYPDARTIHLVVDNLNTHHRKAPVDHYGEQAGGRLWSRFTVHYTPKHGSWLNQAEIEISLFSRQCLGQRRIPTLTCLRGEAKQWNTRQNEARTTINWQFTRRDARRSFGYNKRFIKRSWH
jgi:transposase